MRFLRLPGRKPEPEPEPDWHEVAWAKMPIEQRLTACKKLREIFDHTFFAEVRERVEHYGLGEWLPPGWHFSQGMAIRNVLRGVIRDDELPPLPEYYGDDVRNWDDYYVQCIEAAAGSRPGWARP